MLHAPNGTSTVWFGLAIAATLNAVARNSGTATRLWGDILDSLAAYFDSSQLRARYADRTCRSPSDEIAPHADLFFGPRFRHAEAQCVAHSFFFGPQIREGVRIRRSLAAEHGHHLDAVLRQCARFARIVREQTNPLDPKIAQDRSRP